MSQPGRIGTLVAASLAASSAPEAALMRISALSETSSTNDSCREMALAGAPEWTVVIADVQSKGRGRLGREWSSPAGCGLWCSVLLRPAVPLARLGPLALVIAVGAHQALTAVGAAGLEIKWPNDLLWRGRKLAGILTETPGPGAADAPPRCAIAGIGINLRVPPLGFPESIAGNAVALEEITGEFPDVGRLGALLLQQLYAGYHQLQREGFGGLREQWLARTKMMGLTVTATSPGGDTLGGIAETIDLDGQLVLRLESGATVTVAAADVTLRQTQATHPVTHRVRDGG